MSIQNTIYQGDTVTIYSPKVDYKTGDSAQIVFYGAINTTFNTTTYNNGKWEFEILMDLTAGDYNYQLRIVHDGKFRTIETGEFTIVQVDGSSNLKSTTEQMIELIDNYLLDPNNYKYSSESIAGVSITRYSISELLKIKKELKKELAAKTRKYFKIHRFGS